MTIDCSINSYTGDCGLLPKAFILACPIENTNFEYPQRVNDFWISQPTEPKEEKEDHHGVADAIPKDVTNLTLYSKSPCKSVANGLISLDKGDIINEDTIFISCHQLCLLTSLQQLTIQDIRCSIDDFVLESM